MGNVTTWADGMGTWHARVSRLAPSPISLASSALRTELTAREAHCHPATWQTPTLVPELSDLGALVYRESLPANDEEGEILSQDRIYDEYGTEH